MLKDNQTCEHKLLVETRSTRGTVSIVFHRETNVTEETHDEGMIRGQPRKWCYCENCGKRFPNPRYKDTDA